MPSSIVQVYDAENPLALPPGPYYLAYDDGIVTFNNYNEVCARFPNATVIPITVTGQNPNAVVCDCESGDLSPQSAAQWAKGMLTRGKRPCIYCSTSLYSAVQGALLQLGLSFTINVDWWEANYTSGPSISPNAIGKQYQSTTYDTSNVYLSWIESVTGNPQPSPNTEVEMAIQYKIVDPGEHVCLRIPPLGTDGNPIGYKGHYVSLATTQGPAPDIYAAIGNGGGAFRSVFTGQPQDQPKGNCIGTVPNGAKIAIAAIEHDDVVDCINNGKEPITLTVESF